MITNYNLALILSLLSIVGLAALIKYYNTALLGFTVFSFFNIARASFSAFLFGHLFGLNYFAVTDAHLWVVTYTAIGLLCFTVGAALAWQPLKYKDSSRADHYRLPWLNPHLAVILMIVGFFLYLLSPLALRIPTVQAIWSNFDILPKTGFLIALIYGLNTRRYDYTILCTTVYLILAIVDMVRSGHIFGPAIFLIQALFVLVFWQKVNFRSLVQLSIGFLLFGSIFIGWLDSRYMIRQGYLDNYSIFERIVRFYDGFQFVSPLEMSPVKVYASIKARLDLSDILAEQVLFQPKIQPYAYGGTVTTDILGALIPRFLWPTKPALAGGSEFVSRYTGLIWRDTSMGLPYHFELYANGGGFAVFLGLFTIGWLTAKLEIYLITTKLELPQLLGVFTILFSLIGWEARLVQICITIIAGFSGVFLLAKGLTLFKRNGWFWTQLEPYQAARSGHTTRIYYLPKPYHKSS